ncbi:hypothetical protein NOR53_2592 [gamma proteobacterium NOR5-3]|nr:hypothetical protein NOR53_2592 [gamma proteobacterium NOR5-3]
MKLKKRLTYHESGKELYFTEADARALELIIERLHRGNPTY